MSGGFGDDLFSEFEFGAPIEGETGGAISGGPIGSVRVPLGTAAGTNPGLAPDPISNILVLQLALEVMEAQESAIQVSQLSAEVLSVKEPNLRVGAVVAEVLRSNTPFVHPIRPGGSTHRRR